MVQQPFSLELQKAIQAERDLRAQRRQEQAAKRKQPGPGIPELVLGDKVGGSVRRGFNEVARAAEPAIEFATTPLIPESTFSGLPTPLRVAGEAVSGATTPLGLGIAGAAIASGGAAVPILAGELGASLAYETAEELGAPTPVKFAAGLAGGIATGSPFLINKFKQVAAKSGPVEALLEINDGVKTGGLAGSALQFSELRADSVQTLTRSKPVTHVTWDERYRNADVSGAFPRAGYDATPMPGSELAEMFGDTLWHVTMEGDAVLKSGVLKSGMTITNEMTLGVKPGGLSGLAGRNKQLSLTSSKAVAAGLAQQFTRNYELFTALNKGTFASSISAAQKLVRQWADEDIKFLKKYITPDPEWEMVFGEPQNISEFITDGVAAIKEAANQTVNNIEAVGRRAMAQYGLNAKSPAPLQSLVYDSASRRSIAPGLTAISQSVTDYRFTLNRIEASTAGGRPVFIPDLTMESAIAALGEEDMLPYVEDVLRRGIKNIGVVAVATRDIDPNVLAIRNFEDVTSEVAIMGDVALKSARFIPARAQEFQRLLLSQIADLDAPASAAEGLSSKILAGAGRATKGAIRKIEDQALPPLQRPQQMGNYPAGRRVNQLPPRPKPVADVPAEDIYPEARRGFERGLGVPRRYNQPLRDADKPLASPIEDTFTPPHDVTSLKPGDRITYQSLGGRRVNLRVTNDGMIEREPRRQPYPALGKQELLEADWANKSRGGRGVRIARGKRAMVDRIDLATRTGGPDGTGWLNGYEAEELKRILESLPNEYFEDVTLSIRGQTGEMGIQMGYSPSAMGRFTYGDNNLELFMKIINSSPADPMDVLVHEMSHNLFRYVPNDDVKLLMKQYKKEAELFKQGKFPQVQRFGEPYWHEEYRFRNFPEWFAETMADRFGRDLWPEATRKQLDGLYEHIKSIAIGIYNWLMRNNRVDEAERIYRNLISGEYAKTGPVRYGPGDLGNF